MYSDVNLQYQLFINGPSESPRISWWWSHDFIFETGGECNRVQRWDTTVLKFNGLMKKRVTSTTVMEIEPSHPTYSEKRVLLMILNIQVHLWHGMCLNHFINDVTHESSSRRTKHRCLLKHVLCQFTEKVIQTNFLGGTLLCSKTMLKNILLPQQRT